METENLCLFEREGAGGGFHYLKNYSSCISFSILKNVKTSAFCFFAAGVHHFDLFEFYLYLPNIRRKVITDFLFM